MARQRLRPEWPIVAYKFWIQPTAIPPHLWETARQMQALWNRLVDLRQAAAERLQTAEPKLGEADKKIRYAELDAAMRHAADQSPLNWECREFVLDKFRLAVRTAITRIKQGVPPAQAGFPKPRSRLRKIAIPHRYTGGGVPIADLIQPQPAKSAKRFWLQPVLARAYLDNARRHKRLRYSQGFFGLGGARIPFRVLLHRPLPPEAIVKQVILIGQHRRPFGWEWAVALICELPLSPAPSPRTGRMCGLDLGWRKFDTYLRIGMLVDNTGHVIELRLPLAMPNRRTRQFNQWIEQASRPEADKIYESWDDLRAAASRADQALEWTKAQVAQRAETMELPDDIRASLEQITTMRQGGLMRLLRALQEAGVGQELQTLILAWKARQEQAQRRMQSARVRFVRRRQSLYHNVAAWIAKTYDIIAWESGLGIKVMAEEEEKATVLKQADRYRHMAAIGEFKDLLRQQVKKRQAQLIDGGAAYSSTTCFTCGAATEGGPQLRLQCPNGHRFDQDENAARWFLAQIDPAVSGGVTRRPATALPLPPPMEVPEGLKSVVVYVQES